jgi:hypothetical protein
MGYTETIALFALLATILLGLVGLGIDLYSRFDELHSRLKSIELDLREIQRKLDSIINR